MHNTTLNNNTNYPPIPIDQNVDSRSNDHESLARLGKTDEIMLENNPPIGAIDERYHTLNTAVTKETGFLSQIDKTDRTKPSDSAQPLYTQTELQQSIERFEQLRDSPFQLPSDYAWFDTHAAFIFQGELALDELDEANRFELEHYASGLRKAAYYHLGLLTLNNGSLPLQNTKPLAHESQLAWLVRTGCDSKHILIDLLGLKLLDEDNILNQLEFDACEDYRRFARIYALIKNLYTAVDPMDEYTRITDEHHPKNVICQLKNKSSVALLTAAAFHDFERYVPGIRSQKIANTRLDELIRKQAIHPLNSAKLAMHLLQLAPLTQTERSEVFQLIRGHDAGPDGMSIKGYTCVPAPQGEIREKLTDLTNADTAAFFDHSAIQDPTVEVFVKDRITNVIEKTLPIILGNQQNLTLRSKEQIAQLAVQQYLARNLPLNVAQALTEEDQGKITDYRPLNEALEKELNKLVARITKHANRVSDAMLSTVATLHAERPRTDIDALVHAALKKYDKMNTTLKSKSFKHAALTVIAAHRFSYSK